MDIRIQVNADDGERHDEILTPEALEFLTRLHDLFMGRRQERLSGRMLFRQAIDNGRNLRFLDDTEGIRADRSWRVAGPGPGLYDRRVEITGPTDRKMTVNALNSGAKVWLADFEDATSPTWANIIGGQINLFDAIRHQVDFTSDEGKEYRLAETSPTNPGPTIVARPRGWHLVEKHLRYIDQAGTAMPASASLIDFGLYFFHNATELIARGAGPYFYLPKLENHLEARLWNDVFTFAEAHLGIPHGTIRATVLIETITAAFEMEEILYELRDHCAGLNAGRWDYVFSIIKNFRGRGKRFVLPDRTQITMTTPFMRAYTELLVSTCHQRGAHAIGGMSAFIPNRKDPEATKLAFEKVTADKRREATDGFDGTWVAHPDLVAVARAEFDAVLGEKPNQVDRLREDVKVSAHDLTDLTFEGTVTDAGVRANVSVALRYIEAWLRGTGAVAIDGLMEDAATAEISRSQLWQWAEQRVVTAEGTRVTHNLIERILIEELARWVGEPDNRFEDAATIFRDTCLEHDFPPFLTIPAYTRYLVDAPTLAAVSR
jgi:malate synthase